MYLKPLYMGSKKKIVWKSMATVNCQFPTFFKISSFVFTEERNIRTHTGLEKHGGE